MYYSLSIGTGSGVFFIDKADKNRVKHEIDNLPETWYINIWLFNSDNIPVRKCSIEEFKEA